MSENGWTKGPWVINKAINNFHVWSEGAEKDVAVAFHGQDDDADAREAAANARLIAASPALADVASAYEQWEAELVLCNDAWAAGREGLPVFTGALWDRLLEIQAMRNTALALAKGRTV